MECRIQNLMLLKITEFCEMGYFEKFLKKVRKISQKSHAINFFLFIIASMFAIPFLTHSLTLKQKIDIMGLVLLRGSGRIISMQFASRVAVKLPLAISFYKHLISSNDH